MTGTNCRAGREKFARQVEFFAALHQELSARWRWWRLDALFRVRIRTAGDLQERITKKGAAQ
jgi:hypothetical protein